MAHPKRRQSSSRQGKRRSHDKIGLPAISACPRCSAMCMPHKVCPNCGTYKGEEVTTPKID